MSTSQSTFSRPATRLLLTLTLVSGLLGGVTATTGAAPAQARTTAVTASTANRAVSYAAAKRGAPYKYGAAGPSRFDCSGLTKWSYSRAGRWLPRTTRQQYAATTRVSRTHLRKGDLVFFLRGRTPYHVGIYAGSQKVWHAPKPGQRVKLSRIWTTAVAYGRVR